MDSITGTIFAGKYEILCQIGSGGMSSVYKARHLTLNKLCALKVLHSQHRTRPEQILRFQQEARTIAGLAHPNIITVHEFAVADTSDPYLEMDLLEGVSLQDVLDKERYLSIAEFVHIFNQVLTAMSHAHKLGVIHRDLKPSNIMLVGERPESTVKVLDFGIAKVVAETDTNSGSHKLTRTGELFGSPLYMSPEQCAGEPMDKRSDIYTLGCVMFECLTGTAPFRSDSILRTLNLHVTAPVPVMKEVAPTVAIPDSFQEVIETAMQKEPGRRFQDAESFRQALQKAMKFAGSTPLPARLRRTLARFLQDDKTKPPAERAKRWAFILSFYLLIGSVAVIVIAQHDVGHFQTLISWRLHNAWGYQAFEDAPRMKTVEAREAKWRKALQEFDVGLAEAEKYSKKDFAFSRWMRYTSHVHKAQLFGAMGKMDLAQTELAAANSLYMEPITKAADIVRAGDKGR